MAYYIIPPTFIIQSQYDEWFFKNLNNQYNVKNYLNK